MTNIRAADMRFLDDLFIQTLGVRLAGWYAEEKRWHLGPMHRSQRLAAGEAQAV